MNQIVLGAAGPFLLVAFLAMAGTLTYMAWRELSRAERRTRQGHLA